ncbi:MAG: hypothetical protein ACPLOU_08400 [bacterium]
MRSGEGATLKKRVVQKLVLRLLKAIYIILDLKTPYSPEEIERAYQEMRAVLEELGVNAP